MTDLDLVIIYLLEKGIKNLTHNEEENRWLDI